MSDELIRLDDAIALFDAPNIIEDLRALPAVSPGVTPEAETERVFMDAVWDATGFRGTPEQLINAISEMVRREPRQMQGAILRAALSALTAANARADALEQQVADLLADVPCACGYDNPDDVCMKHLPLFRRLKAQLADAEPKALRAAADMVMQKTYRVHAPKDFRDGYDVAKADVATAILALIPKEGA